MDVIFNFEKAHFVWNEMVLGGEMMEASKHEVLNSILDQDDIQRDEIEKSQNSLF